MNYSELKQKQHDVFNNFKHIFFAYSDKQFKEGMAKLNLNPDNDLNKIVSVNSCGCYVLKEYLIDFKQLFVDADLELEEFLKDESNLLDALIYELNNHEYCITYDIDPALDALGLEQSQINPDILKKAKQKSL